MTSLRHNSNSPYILSFHAIVFLGVVAFLLLRCEPLPRCSSDKDCSRPLRCESGRCQASCLVNTDCSAGQVCQNLQCVYPNTITVPDSSPIDEPLSCKYVSQKQIDSNTTVTILCNGQTTQLTYTKEQSDPCKTCKENEVCNEGQCWGKGTKKNPGKSCQDIREAYTSSQNKTLQNGIYWIHHPEEKTQQLRVYCDMVTAGGGWTLCLNSRYTAEASKKLFLDSYQKVYPPTLSQNQHPDPFSTYDFCPTNRKSYRMTLAKSPGLRYSHGIVDFTLSNAKPLIQTQGNEQFYGIQSSKRQWIAKPLDFNVENKPPPKEIRFWWYVNTSQFGTNGIFRGFAQVTSSESSENIWIGAGCYNNSCLVPKTGHHTDNVYGENKVTLLASYIRWSKDKKPSALLKAFRVQVYYQ